MTNTTDVSTSTSSRTPIALNERRRLGQTLYAIAIGVPLGIVTAVSVTGALSGRGMTSVMLGASVGFLFMLALLGAAAFILSRVDKYVKVAVEEAVTAAQEEASK